MEKETTVVSVDELEGVSLRYTLANLLGYTVTLTPPEYGVGYRVKVVGVSGYFRPDQDWGQLGDVIETHCLKLLTGIQLTDINTLQSFHTDTQKKATVCRILVRGGLGGHTEVTVPTLLLREVRG